MVFNDQRVTEYFNLNIWVCVSDDFNVKRFIKVIVEYIEAKSMGVMDMAPLQKSFRNYLMEKDTFLFWMMFGMKITKIGLMLEPY